MAILPDVVANLEMVLAKTDMGIASRYAELVPDRDAAGRRSSTRISRRARADRRGRPEHHRADSSSSASNPHLARAIRNRAPYLDPLNHLQVELLKRYRSGRASDRIVRGIHLTINGIAAGLRNSG